VALHLAGEGGVQAGRRNTATTPAAATAVVRPVENGIGVGEFPFTRWFSNGRKDGTAV
jgi:hypothetical protein